MEHDDNFMEQDGNFMEHEENPMKHVGNLMKYYGNFVDLKLHKTDFQTRPAFVVTTCFGSN